MKAGTFFYVVAAILISGYTRASKVYSVNHNDWFNPSTWNTNQVPVNPDTIVIKHYVTFSQTLAITAPSVLLIEAQGTLCGDFFLDQLCGSRVINYGHVYINGAKLRDFTNYNYFYSKGSLTISGCSQAGYGTGLINHVPGLITVWSKDVPCKSSGTNWENGGPTALNEFQENQEFLICYDPINNRNLMVSADQEIKVEITDLTGKSIWKNEHLNSYSILMDSFPPGFYLISVIKNNRQYSRRFMTW